MKVKLFWCLWYFFFIGHGFNACVAMMEWRQSNLSAICADHHCACTMKGSCAVSCCCAGTSEEEDHEDRMTEFVRSCGGEPEQARPIPTKPHFPSKDLVFVFRTQPATEDGALIFQLRWRPQEPPMKVPIA